ncbi:MAG: hypothetical protein DHS20C15_28600 [Planctomycetota bacterium]|nr:MAG: hypothetical protein DHS20C15_28600 [Planctomycetota bacterium]
MTTCREIHDFLMTWLDGELEPAVNERFEHHIAACSCCNNYVDSYRKTVELGRTAFDPCGDAASESTDAAEVHPPLPDELVQAVLAARRKASPPGDGA